MKLDFSNSFSHKIKTVEELEQILGPFPRKDRVIMCHGVFDVVHPGHIRHLLFAKNKAPKLVVSLTSDIHINKGVYRPHVPEDLRAVNLAVLEFVDFVIIDNNKTPIQNLLKIKPDIFTKGYEYSAKSQPTSHTSEEITAVESYGGQVIFSPGDFVMSSSSYINQIPPDIRMEKLIMLMKRSGITFDDLEKTLESFDKKVVHVIGDTIIDTQSRCSMIGGQIKTPTLSVSLDEKVEFLGGAGVVASHLKAAGAKVKISTILGDDKLGKFAKETFKRLGIKDLSIVDTERPTTNKDAILVGNYRVLKIDTVENRTISDNQLDLLVKSFSKSRSDAIVFSDFRHGIFNKRTIRELTDAIPPKTFRVADSQVASRWGNILDFPSFDLITPNEREARFSLGDQDSGIRSLASELYKKSKCKLLIMKLSEKGILTCLSEDSPTLDTYFVMDSFVSNLVDPVGAGDALLAYSTLAMLVSNNPVISSILGNLAAACECELEGNVPVTQENILSKIRLISENSKY
jgi:rfaE bifunctional protein kinase chain/domain